jgi:hypothetical protein
VESREVVPARARRIVRSRQSRHDSKVSAREVMLARARRRMRS